MTPARLDEIEARYRSCVNSRWTEIYASITDVANFMGTDVPALIAEVRRLREALQEIASMRHRSRSDTCTCDICSTAFVAAYTLRGDDE